MLIIYVTLLLVLLSVAQSLRLQNVLLKTDVRLSRDRLTSALFAKTPLVAGGKRFEAEPGSSMLAVTQSTVLTDAIYFS